MTNCRSLSIVGVWVVVLEGMGPNPPPFDPGKKKIPAGWPSGLWITSPDEGEVPSFIAVSEKYSMLSEMERGDGGTGAYSRSPCDFMDLSESARRVEAVGLGPCRPFVDHEGNKTRDCDSQELQGKWRLVRRKDRQRASSKRYRVRSRLVAGRQAWG
jgi:hypothetical protein